MRTVAVVLAGGSGLRFGGSTPKQFQLLAGRTLVEHCVAAFDAAPAVDEVLVVIGADYVATAAAQLGRYDKLVDVVAGGSARTDSTQQAIAAITAMAADAATGPDAPSGPTSGSAADLADSDETGRRPDPDRRSARTGRPGRAGRD